MYTLKSNDGHLFILNIESDVLETLSTFPSSDMITPIELRNFSGSCIQELIDININKRVNRIFILY